jgi:hypothetical protein
MMTIIPWKLMFYEPIIHYSNNYRDSRGIVEEVMYESISNSKNLQDVEWTDWQALFIVAVCTLVAIVFVKYWNQSIYLSNLTDETLEVLGRMDRQYGQRIEELNQRINSLKETLVASGHWKGSSESNLFMERQIISCPKGSRMVRV